MGTSRNGLATGNPVRVAVLVHEAQGLVVAGGGPHHREHGAEDLVVPRQNRIRPVERTSFRGNRPASRLLTRANLRDALDARRQSIAVGAWETLQRLSDHARASDDPAKKVLSGYMEGPDMTGKVVKSKAVTEYKADGSRVFTMYNRTPDGKEVEGMRITYVKRP